MCLYVCVCIYNCFIDLASRKSSSAWNYWTTNLPTEHLDVVKSWIIFQRRQLLETQLLTSAIEPVRAIDANVVVIATTPILHRTQSWGALEEKHWKTKQNKKMKKNFLQVCFHLFLFSGVWDESKISLVAMSADDERTLMIILEKITAVSDCFKVVQCMKSAVVCKWAALNLHSAFLWKHHAF